MKILKTTIIFLSFLLPLQGQITSNKNYAIEEEQFMKQQLVDAKSCFFKTQEDISRVWKFNGIDLLNTSFNFTDPIKESDNGIEISFEQKITTGLSINTSVRGYLMTFKLDQKNTTPTDFLRVEYGVVFSVESRWYFQKRKQIRKGKSGDNLSGIYLSLLAGIDRSRSTYEQYYFKQNPSNTGVLPVLLGTSKGGLSIRSTVFTANIGIQKQFAKNGFFDLKFGFGLKEGQYDSFTQHIGERSLTEHSKGSFTVGTLDLGLGFVIDNHVDKELPKDCAIFEYHTNKNRLFKISTINPIRFLKFKRLKGEFTIGVEQKIRQSPFSMNLNIVGKVWIYPDANTSSEAVIYGEVEPRFYYNLKKRMAQGKTGNSFSANYIGLRSKYQFNYDEYFGLAPVWGVQRQFFKRLLFDYKLGPELRINSFNKNKNILFFSELKIGLAF